MISWLARRLATRVAAIAWLALMLVFTSILVVVVVEVLVAPSMVSLAIALFIGVAFGPPLWCEWRQAPRMAQMLRSGT